jgi:hypothetical protein
MGVSIWTKQGTVLILKRTNWTVEAINEAMKGEKQTIHILTNEIGTYSLFYRWVDDIGRSIFMIYIKETIV